MVDGESEIFCEQVTRNLLFHTHDDTLNTILRTDKGIVVAGIGYNNIGFCQMRNVGCSVDGLLKRINALSEFGCNSNNRGA